MPVMPYWINRARTDRTSEAALRNIYLGSAAVAGTAAAGIGFAPYIAAGAKWVLEKMRLTRSGHSASQSREMAQAPAGGNNRMVNRPTFRDLYHGVRTNSVSRSLGRSIVSRGITAGLNRVLPRRRRKATPATKARRVVKRVSEAFYPKQRRRARQAPRPKARRRLSERFGPRRRTRRRTR